MSVVDAAAPVAARRRAHASTGSELPVRRLSLGSPLRSARRIALYLAVTAATIPLQAFALALKLPLGERLPIAYHRTCCRIFGLRVERIGPVSAARPTLFVSNHSSYLDIMVLSTLTAVSFVAKAEVAGWPFFGLLAKLQRTVFVDRRRSTTHDQRDEIARRLAAGDNLMLFPEGTSNDGNRILPFRSALLSVAERRGAGTGGPDPELVVQPVSIAYTHLDGMPIGHALRPLVAWYGDMNLLGHLWQMAGLGRITAVVEFHPAVTIADFGSRKSLTDHCQRRVASGVSAALRGGARPAISPPPPASPA